MTTLVYSEDDLMSEHTYASPHQVGEVRLHGGFLDDGTYQPPRSLGRTEALDAWTAALRERGGDLLEADASLLAGLRYPNLEQYRLLLREGLGRPFWNMLTITGKIEAKGQLLAELTFPDLQDVIVDDISEMAIGHLNKGLLVAHGLDEGGAPAEGIGGHDVMWFAARDLAFGEGAYPDIEPMSNIGRFEAPEPVLPELPGSIEMMLSFLINLLIIEFRAELGFALSQALLRTPGLFEERADEAELAAEMIERIRTDEEVHVSSLRLYLGELRQVTFKTNDGGELPGAEVIDRLWGDLAHWATVEQPALVAQEQVAVMRAHIDEHPEAERVWAEFERLGDAAA